MIYIDDNIDAIELETALTLLPEWRRKQALAHRHELDRRLSVAAYRLLAAAAETEFGLKDLPEFGYAEGGKPYIPGHPDIHFNLSHCPVAALCATSHSPVGADIERIRPYNAALAHRVLNDAEMAVVEASARPEVEFARLWTMKESLLKLTGEGIRRDLKSALDGCTTRFSTTVNTARGYVFTVCTER